MGTRLAVNGTPEQFDKLRPQARSQAGDGPVEYDETGLAEELASLGFYLVDPAEGTPRT